jgi:cell division septal protein FtsQ
VQRHNRRVKKSSSGPESLAQSLQAFCLLLFRTAFISVVGVGLVILGVSGTRAFMAIDALKLTTVHVRGAQRATREALLDAAGVHYGDALLQINLHTAAAGMLAHPWVQGATIRRQWPNRVHIEVTEHVPKALVMLDSLWLLSAEAQLIKPFSHADNLHLPVITGLDGPALVEGPMAASEPMAALDRLERAERQRPRLKEALSLLDHLDGTYGDAFSVQEVHADEDLGFDAYLLPLVPRPHSHALPPRAILVRLGNRPSERVDVLQKTLAALQPTAVQPAIIWANGDRAPHRVQVTPHDAGLFSTMGAEKSQSVSNRRTMPLRTLPKR